MKSDNDVYFSNVIVLAVVLYHAIHSAFVRSWCCESGVGESLGSRTSEQGN